MGWKRPICRHGFPQLSWIVELVFWVYRNCDHENLFFVKEMCTRFFQGLHFSKLRHLKNRVTHSFFIKKLFSGWKRPICRRGFPEVRGIIELAFWVYRRCGHENLFFVKEMCTRIFQGLHFPKMRHIKISITHSFCIKKLFSGWKCPVCRHGSPQVSWNKGLAFCWYRRRHREKLFFVKEMCTRGVQNSYMVYRGWFSKS